MGSLSLSTFLNGQNSQTWINPTIPLLEAVKCSPRKRFHVKRVAVNLEGAARLPDGLLFSEAVSHAAAAFAALQLFSKRPRPAPPASQEPPALPVLRPVPLQPLQAESQQPRRGPAFSETLSLGTGSPLGLPSLTDRLLDRAAALPPTSAPTPQAPPAPEPVTSPNGLDQRPSRAVRPGGSDPTCAWLSSRLTPAAQVHLPGHLPDATRNRWAHQAPLRGLRLSPGPRPS